MGDGKRPDTPEEAITPAQRHARRDSDEADTGVPGFDQDSATPADDSEATDDVDTLKARTARGSLGPEKQKGYGQGA